jgi:phosphatidylserine/phosphatidylglycerophosphate/cardiolipin synthase-like enzyme
MTRFARLTVLGLILLVTDLVAADAATRRPPPAAAEEDGIRLYFSPDGGAADAVVAEMAGARKTLDVAVYSVTHPQIAKAVADAHRRGVRVRVLLDKSQSSGRYSSATYLLNAGVPVWTDADDGLMHHKYAVVDGRVVITGSFNFTKSGDQKKAENLLIVEGKAKLVEAYQRNFERLLTKAKRYEGIAGGDRR